jgi:hypothetical protein
LVIQKRKKTYKKHYKGGKALTYEQNAIKQYYTKLAFGQYTTENEKILLADRIAKMNDNSTPLALIEPEPTIETVPMSEPESPYVKQSYSHRGNRN